MRIQINLSWRSKDVAYSGSGFGVSEWHKTEIKNFPSFDPDNDTQSVYLYMVRWTLIFVNQSHPYSVGFNNFKWDVFKSRIDKAIKRYVQNGVGQGQYEFFPGAGLVSYTITFRLDNNWNKKYYDSYEALALAIINGKAKFE
jgi:hypothetical protein